jgi:hypothetical protein
MNTTTITTLDELTNEDRLDSRDLVELIDDLEAQQDEAIEDKHDPSWDHTDGAALLDALRAMRTETEPYAGDSWEDGVFFIRDSDFESYAQEFAEDCGFIDASADWPNTCIDWEWAARELRVDYTSVDINGVTYWYR